jgi:hypothetical protein
VYARMISHDVPEGHAAALRLTQVSRLRNKRQETRPRLPFHFHRAFRSTLGETPKGLVQRLRLERAAGPGRCGRCRARAACSAHGGRRSLHPPVPSADSTLDVPTLR